MDLEGSLYLTGEDDSWISRPSSTQAAAWDELVADPSRKDAKNLKGREGKWLWWCLVIPRNESEK